MIIDHVEQTRAGGQSVVSARLRWENSEHPLRTLYFQTDRTFEKHLTPCPEAFLVASLLPAIHFGERRIRVDGPVCPELLDGLTTAMALFHAWYGRRCQPIPLESTRPWPGGPVDARPPRAAVFLSGGVDSLAVLRTNHLTRPHGHPGRFRDGVFIYGHDIGGMGQHGAETPVFERARGVLQGVASDCDIHLIPVRTNVRHLFDDHQFWMRVFYAAALAAVGHALSHRIGQISIASGNVINHLRPWGSHPVLDPCYSSGRLGIRHAGLHQTRLERVRLVARWPAALAGLRVCGHNPPHRLNCGACEKCVRTMVQLAALGKLRDTDAFPVKDITAGMISGQLLLHDYQLAPYRDALPLLIRRGRFDLAHAIRSKIISYNCFYRYLEGVDIKTMLKRADHALFHGHLLDRYRQKKQSRENELL